MIKRVIKNIQRGLFSGSEMVKKRKDDACWFFIHIPKTAGTSFREMLYQYFSQEEIYPNIERIENNGGRYPNFRDIKRDFKEKATVYKDIKLVAGHYPYKLKKSLPDSNIKCLTFLRNPYDRTVSHLIHFKKRKLDCKKLTLEEIFELKQEQVCNLQIKYFMERKNRKSIEEKDIISAKKNLSDCDFVGITETFFESIKSLESLFEISFNQVLAKNVNQKQELISSISDNFKNKIKLANKLDFEFYEFAKEISTNKNK